MIGIGDRGRSRSLIDERLNMNHFSARVSFSLRSGRRLQPPKITIILKKSEGIKNDFKIIFPLVAQIKDILFLSSSYLILLSDHRQIFQLHVTIRSVVHVSRNRSRFRSISNQLLFMGNELMIQLDPKKRLKNVVQL